MQSLRWSEQRQMPESEQDRLARLQAWLADLKLLITEAERVRDIAALEAAVTMRQECEKFIAEAETNIAQGGQDGQSSS